MGGGQQELLCLCCPHYDSEKQTTLPPPPLAHQAKKTVFFSLWQWLIKHSDSSRSSCRIQDLARSFLSTKLTQQDLSKTTWKGISTSLSMSAISKRQLGANGGLGDHTCLELIARSTWLVSITMSLQALMLLMLLCF